MLGTLRYFLSGTVLSIARMLVGLVRVKYVALAYGAAGVGVLAQGTQVQQLAVSIASLSLAAGMIQRMLSGVREGDPARERRVLATSLVAQLVTMAIGAAIAFAFLPEISRLIFDREDMTIHFAFIILSVPFYVLSSGFIEALFFALDRFDLYVKSSVAAAVLSLIAFVGLIHFYGIYGMFLSFAVSGALFLLLNIIFIYHERKPGDIFYLTGFSWLEFRALFQYSFVLMVGGMAVYLGNLVLRTYVVKKLGMEVNGLVQVPVALSAYYSSLLTNLMWSKLHVRASQEGDTPVMHRDFFHLLDFLIFAQVGIGLCLMAGIEMFIRIIYTKEFVIASPMAAVFFIGDFFYFSIMAFGIYLLGIGSMRKYLFLILLQGIFFVALGYFLEPILKAEFFSAAYLGAALLTSLPVLYWMFRMAGMSFTEKLKYFARQGVCCGFLLVQAFLLYRGVAWQIRVAFAALFLVYAVYFFFRSGYLQREGGRIRLKL